MIRNINCHNETEGCFNQDIYHSIHVMMLDLDLNDYDYDTVLDLNMLGLLHYVHTS